MFQIPEPKRAALASVNPLAQAVILQQVFAFLGLGHYYYVSTVSKDWLHAYERVGSITTREWYYDSWSDYERYETLTIVPQTTLVSAIFNSPSRVKLADAAGLRLADLGARAHYVAGKSASVNTLSVALERGMRCTDELLQGAAMCGSLSKLQWLYTEQRCQFPGAISNWAAMHGSTDVLRFLKQCGCRFDIDTCY
jgi:hypothetical protein